MIQQTIDLFRKEQTMSTPNFEIYNYSDLVPPKVFPHTHNFYEIYYLLSDSLIYMISGKEFRMEQGDFLMIPPDVLHYPSDVNVRHGKNYARIVLWITRDFFNQIAGTDTILREIWEPIARNEAYHVRPRPAASQEILDCLRRLVYEQQHKNLSTALMSHAILTETFVNIQRSMHTMSHFEQHLTTSSLFSNVINFIHAHLAEDLSLNRLSEEFYVTKGYISRQFREYMGVSAHQYILMLRLEGCRKAMEDDLPINECISMYGFQDYSSFYRAFKGAFKVSPREYQRRHMESGRQTSPLNEARLH